MSSAGGSTGGPAVRRGWATHRLVMPAVAVVAIFGTYGVTSAAGVWQSSGRQPVAGQSLAPADLKGWMTLQQASEGLGIDIPTLLRLAGADAATAAAVTPATPLNQLEERLPSFSMEAFRASVTDFREHGGAAAPAPGPSPSAVPTTASTTPSPRPSSSGTGPGAGSGSGTAAGSGTGAGTSAGTGVTGQMTLAQVSQTYGIAPPELIAASRLPADVPTDIPLRSLKERVPGFEISVVRDAVTALKGG